jgi:hypothetical protein
LGQSVEYFEFSGDDLVSRKVTYLGKSSLRLRGRSFAAHLLQFDAGSFRRFLIVDEKGNGLGSLDRPPKSRTQIVISDFYGDALLPTISPPVSPGRRLAFSPNTVWESEPIGGLQADSPNPFIAGLVALDGSTLVPGLRILTPQPSTNFMRFIQDSQKPSVFKELNSPWGTVYWKPADLAATPTQATGWSVPIVSGSERVAYVGIESILMNSFQDVAVLDLELRRSTGERDSFFSSSVARTDISVVCIVSASNWDPLTKAVEGLRSMPPVSTVSPRTAEAPPTKRTVADPADLEKFVGVWWFRNEPLDRIEITRVEGKFMAKRVLWGNATEYELIPKDDKGKWRLERAGGFEWYSLNGDELTDAAQSIIVRRPW